jgi:hypothetical protein
LTAVDDFAAAELVRAAGRLDCSLARADGAVLGASTVRAGEGAATGTWADPLELHAADKVAAVTSPAKSPAARTDAYDFRIAIPASISSTSFAGSTGAD